jgi:hypothetical protein
MNGNYSTLKHSLGHSGNPIPDMVVWEDEFLSIDLDTTNGPYRFNVAASGTFSILDEANGILRLSASANANSGVTAQGRSNVFFPKASDRSIGFSWRGRVNIGASLLAAIGLGEASATHVYAGGTFSSNQFIGFRITGGRLEAVTRAGGSPTVVDLQAVPANGEFFQLGFQLDNRDNVRFFVNGLWAADIKLTIPAATQGLAVTIGALHAAGNASARVDTDYVLASQER